MQHINSFTGGMKGGIDYTIIPQDSYQYLLNGCLISKDEHGYVITSIKGTTQIGQFSPSEVPIGSTSFNGILYIITHKDSTDGAVINFYSYKDSNIPSGESALNILPNGDADDLSIPESVLGFSKRKLLQVFAKESYDGSVDLYICDGLSPNAVVNTGINRDGIITKRKYNLNNPIEFALQKSVTKVPTVTSSIGNTGNLKPGTYYIYLRYDDDSMNSTPFIKEHGPIFIHAGNILNNDISGALNEEDARVNKKIILKVTNIDPLYNKLSVGIVHYFGMGGYLSRDNYMINKTYSITDDSSTIVIDGDQSIRSLTVEEIMADNLPYDTSETHLQLDNRYYAANWSGTSIDYSSLKDLATRIIPHAVLDEETNFDAVVDENTDKFEYMEEEIYPFGVVFLIDGRYKTPVFPICGWYEGSINKSSYISIPDEPYIYVGGGQPLTITSFTVHVTISKHLTEVITYLNIGLILSAGKAPTKEVNDRNIVLGGNESFDARITVDGLEPDTEYFMLAYAEDIDNYYYTGTSSPHVVTTLDGTITFSVPYVNDISPISKKFTSFIISYGGDDILEKGICWSDTNVMPTTSDNKQSGLPLPGSLYVQEVTGLTINTLYFVRSYARNSRGTHYSDVISTVTMRGHEILRIKSVTLDVGSISVLISIEPDSGSESQIYGCIAETPNPEYNPDTWTVVTTPLEDEDRLAVFYGTFLPGTTYYIRAYSVNIYAADYSMQSQITIPQRTIEVRTGGVVTTYIHSDYAKLFGDILWVENTSIKTYGICYSLHTGTPTIFDSREEKIYDPETFVPSYTSYLNDLIPDMQYYFRAYAIDYYDNIFYGDIKKFWTRNYIPNIIAINQNLTVRTTTSIRVTVTYTPNDENETIIKGVVYRKNFVPTLDNYLGNITSGSYPSDFTILITELEPGEMYYIMPYAIIDNYGRLEGEPVHYRTKPIL